MILHQLSRLVQSETSGNIWFQHLINQDQETFRGDHKLISHLLRLVETLWRMVLLWGSSPSPAPPSGRRWLSPCWTPAPPGTGSAASYGLDTPWRSGGSAPAWPSGRSWLVYDLVSQVSSLFLLPSEEHRGGGESSSQRGCSSKHDNTTRNQQTQTPLCVKQHLQTLLWSIDHWFPPCCITVWTAIHPASYW